MNMVNNERGQSLINKYVWVIETIYRRRKISFKELNELWLNDDDISRGVDIPKRTFDNWRYAIWDMFGINIVNENRGEYRYYIENEGDISKNGLRSWLYNTFCVSNALAESQSIKDRILLEYVPSGQKYLQPIIKAMKENRVLNITYHDYNKDEENSFDVHPYCVKLFRQRWYLVARKAYPNEKNIGIYKLDCVNDLLTKDETFKMPKGWNAEEFFDGCFGINADQQIANQTVKLKVSAGLANNLRDLPIHETQEEVVCNDEYSIFSYYLRPEFNFQQELLWNGEDLEVLEPLWLRNVMARKIERMLNKYTDDHIKDLVKRGRGETRFNSEDRNICPAGLKNYAAIDFETANYERSSVCSVGVVIVQDGEIVDSFYSLVCPKPNYYNNFCSNIHGLSQRDTDNAPIFPEVWARIEPLIGGLPLVAHNKTFDEGCLKAVFRVYQMEYPDYEFYDTLAASRQKFPKLPNYQFGTVAAECGYNLEGRHHPLSDVEACAWIARKIFE